MNEHDHVPPFHGFHDPILVPAAKFDTLWTLWKWWCNCGKGGKSAQDYIEASKSATIRAEAKNAKISG